MGYNQIISKCFYSKLFHVTKGLKLIRWKRNFFGNFLRDSSSASLFSQFLYNNVKFD